MADLRSMGFGGGNVCARQLLEALGHEFERLEAENHNLRDAVSRMSPREVVSPGSSKGIGEHVVVIDEVVDIIQKPPQPPAMTSSTPITRGVSSETLPKSAWGETSSARTGMRSWTSSSALKHTSKKFFSHVAWGGLSTSKPTTPRTTRTSLSLSSELDPQRGEAKLWHNLFHRDAFRPMFPDPEDMKQIVKSHLNRKTKYRVEDLYKYQGVWQAIARSNWFETLTMVVIGLNSIWIAIDTDHNNEEILIDAHPVFIVAEQAFCIFFTGELLIRFMAFRHKRDSLMDAWFAFDLSLVCLMVLESWILVVATWILSFNRSGERQLSNASILKMARLLRILRMLRISRLMRAMPEFAIILKALSAACRAVFFTLVFLVIILYVFGIAFASALKDTEMESQFPNVLESMQRLFFQVVLFDEIITLVLELSETDLFILFLLYVLATLGGLMFMNMLIGVLCEAVNAVADSERTSLHVVSVQATLQKIISLDVDQDHDGLISKEEFVKLISSQEAVLSLENIGVDVVGLVGIADTIFANNSFDDPGVTSEAETYDKRITFDEFMEVLLQLRGSNKATVKDIVELRKEINRAMRMIEKVGSYLYKQGIVPTPTVTKSSTRKRTSPELKQNTLNVPSG